MAEAMPETNISQKEANELIAMEKHRIDDITTYDFPARGEKFNIELKSLDARETFLLDVSRQRINQYKIKYQNRARSTIVLVRLDFAGRPHQNPDSEEIPTPHLHIYREGFGDKWARPLLKELFPNINDPFETLIHFMEFCNITKQPKFNKPLFYDI